MEDFVENNNRYKLLNSVKIVRKKTCDLIENLEIDDLIIQTENYVSPIKWHLGHTSWFFEKFILSNFCKNYKLFNKDYDFIFNSYYETVSHFNLRKNRGNLSRPTINEVLKYRSYIDNNLDFLLDIKSAGLDEMIKVALNHEQQHQELILMDIKNILFSNINKPKYIKKIFSL